jgi:hypothetical protein
MLGQDEKLPCWDGVRVGDVLRRRVMWNGTVSVKTWKNGRLASRGWRFLGFIPLAEARRHSHAHGQKEIRQG